MYAISSCSSLWFSTGKITARWGGRYKGEICVRYNTKLTKSSPATYFASLHFFHIQSYIQLFMHYQMYIPSQFHKKFQFLGKKPLLFLIYHIFAVIDFVGQNSKLSYSTLAKVSKTKRENFLNLVRCKSVRNQFDLTWYNRD